MSELLIILRVISAASTDLLYFPVLISFSGNVIEHNFLKTKLNLLLEEPAAFYCILL